VHRTLKTTAAAHDPKQLEWPAAAALVLPLPLARGPDGEPDLYLTDFAVEQHVDDALRLRPSIPLNRLAANGMPESFVAALTPIPRPGATQAPLPTATH
jgi:hypothetical protein